MKIDYKEASTSSKFHTVQALRDLQSNWEVNLAENLQEYLLKICAGEITGGEDNDQLLVNFDEAALLLQGSIQVDSWKVEYLYSFVLHDLEFISKQSLHPEQPEDALGPEEEQNGSSVPVAETDDPFWCSYDITVDAKNLLDYSNNSDNPLKRFVKPPANLVVLDGDCLDASGDSGELESYLGASLDCSHSTLPGPYLYLLSWQLATTDLYRDFILLDACDAVTVDDFLGGDDTVPKTKSVFKEGSSVGSKSRKTFFSPSKRSGGTGRKQSAVKSHGPDQNQDNPFKTDDHNMHGYTPGCKVNMDHEYDMDDGFSQPEAFDDTDEDDDDPWKPLNPHELGNLKVKPFKNVKAFRRDRLNPSTKVSIAEEFPLAKLHGPISPELHEVWEAQRHANVNLPESESPPLYEKLRRSLVLGDHENTGAFNSDKDDEDNGYDSGAYDFEPPDFDITKDAYMAEDHLNPEKHIDTSQEPLEHEEPNSNVNLEDLCRSHLDSLLASIAETEKQTALAARVSTWKQRIEQNLDEQDARPPFDIHEYGQRTLDILSLEADVGKSLSFTDVVRVKRNTTLLEHSLRFCNW